VDGEHAFKEELRELAEQARHRLSVHPGPEDLLTYHAGALPCEAAGKLQEHLALCPACARTVRDLSAFPHVEPDREEDRLSRAELAAAWSRLGLL
jgi:hypothetical protein